MGADERTKRNIKAFVMRGVVIWGEHMVKWDDVKSKTETVKNALQSYYKLFLLELHELIELCARLLWWANTANCR